MAIGAMKTKTYFLIAFSAVCFAIVFVEDKLGALFRHFLPGVMCVLGGYSIHLALGSMRESWLSITFAVAACVLWAAALEFVEARSRAKGIQRGAELVTDSIVKVMQEQKRP
jgi:hypothetical protein